MLPKIKYDEFKLLRKNFKKEEREWLELRKYKSKSLEFDYEINVNDIFAKFYKRDKNTSPNSYVLLSGDEIVNGSYAILNKDPNKVYKLNEFENELKQDLENKMLSLLRGSANLLHEKGVFTAEQKKKYFVSSKFFDQFYKLRFLIFIW